MFTWNEPINAKSIVISSPSGPQKEEIGSDLIQLNTLSEVVRQIFNYINEHFSWPRGQNELEKIETCCHLLFLTIQKGITQRNKKTSDLGLDLGSHGLEQPVDQRFVDEFEVSCDIKLVPYAPQLLMPLHVSDYGVRSCMLEAPIAFPSSRPMCNMVYSAALTQEETIRN